MKISRIVATALFGLVLLAGNAFAGNKSELHMKTPVTLEGQTIPAGDYTLEYGNATETEMRIKKGNKVIATVHARWVPLDRTSPYDALVVSEEDGVRRLQQIRFTGKNQALEMGPETLANKTDEVSHAKAGAP